MASEEEKEGKKTLNSPLKYFLSPLPSAKPGKQSSSILQKDGFVIRLLSLSDSCFFTLAAN